MTAILTLAQDFANRLREQAEASNYG
jgi:hypothetical protein